MAIPYLKVHNSICRLRSYDACKLKSHAKSFCWHLLEWLSGKKHKTSLTKTSLACKIAAHLIQNLNQPRPQHKMELGNQVWQFGVQNRTSFWHIFRPIPTQNNKNEPASLSNAFAHGFTLSLPLDMIVRRISRYEIRMRLKCRHDFVLFVGQPPGYVCVGCNPVMLGEMFQNNIL